MFFTFLYIVYSQFMYSDRQLFVKGNQGLTFKILSGGLVEWSQIKKISFRYLVINS